MKTLRKACKSEVVSIPLAKLVRHEANRQASIGNDFIESLREHGQVVTLRVRPIAGGKYQIIAGERRWLALKEAGQRVARCEIVRLSDRDALIQLAIDNSQRENINPIERAELLKRLILPEVDGGAGMSRLEAGKLFGLESDSGCKNAIRLLKLPSCIQDVVASGELPEREARSLISLVGTKTMEKIERRMSHNKDKAINQIKRGMYLPLEEANSGSAHSRKRKPDPYRQGVLDSAKVAKECGANSVAKKIMELLG